MKMVLSAYDNQCSMCEEDKISVLVAAHINPAHLCSDDSVNNGICLWKNHDKLYEDGSICVKPDGQIFTRNEKIKLDYDKIRLPKNQDNHPSPERLSQRLELSLRQGTKK